MTHITVELWCLGPGNCGFSEHTHFHDTLRSYCECQRITTRPDLIFQSYRAVDRVLMAQVRAEDPGFVRDARKQYLTDEVAAVRAEMRDDTKFALGRTWGADDIELLRSCYRDKVKRAKKMGGELRGLSRPQSRARITEEQIQQARECPMPDLLDGKRAGDKMLCPAHDDKRDSLHIFADHVHCFSCGFHEGPIGWLMKMRGCSFIEAVRDLIS